MLSRIMPCTCLTISAPTLRAVNELVPFIGVNIHKVLINQKSSSSRRLHLQIVRPIMIVCYEDNILRATEFDLGIFLGIFKML